MLIHSALGQEACRSNQLSPSRPPSGQGGSLPALLAPKCAIPRLWSRLIYGAVPSARPRLAEAAVEFYPSDFRRIAVELAMRRGRMRSRMNSAKAARPRGATCRELIGCIHIGSPSFLNTRWLCDIPNEAMVTVFRNLSDNWLESTPAFAP